MPMYSGAKNPCFRVMTFMLIGKKKACTGYTRASLPKVGIASIDVPFAIDADSVCFVAH